MFAYAKFNKNLIFFGTLDSNSYTFLSEGGVLRVIVAMKGKKVNTLYNFQGKVLPHVIIRRPRLRYHSFLAYAVGYMSER